MKNTNMETLLGLFCTSMMVILAATNVSVEAAKEFKVGGELGWHEPDANNTEMYRQWVAGKRFHVGDSLSFEYHNDSVLVVDKWGFYHCSTSKPIAAFDNGKSIIKLDRPGSFYFISGAPDHCKSGQRLLVDVMSPHYPSPPSITFPPEPDMAGSPSPSPASSGGVPVSVTLSSVFMALIATFVTFSFSC